ncbi:ankyrin repeat-containing protein ITN1-like isoform X2 [Mercurialis annua]|uniref:ankyrin repeat-containing protein ITN1-like isoform X2 n=1 Tax=Mercurialis annua TaxID=3986 RepID=UPI00215E495A|nr:ankyrin repeat-containing protein ITN1-like isoform X2 [Mercurialis annua]
MESCFGVDVTVIYGHKNSILHIAAKLGKIRTAEKIIAICPLLLHQTNSKGDSPLHIAARLGNFQMTQLLINCAKLVEVEVEKELLRMQNLDNDNALHEAVRNGHFEVVNLLIKEDPELSQFVNKAGDSSLFLAVDRKFYKIACLILEAAPMCSYKGRSSMNVLHAAIIRADKRLLFVVTEMVVSIIAMYLRIIFLYANQLLPAACKCLQIKQSYKFSFIGADFIIEVLKRCPSAIAEADKSGWIPLHYAAFMGNVEVVELLLQCDTSLAYVKNKEGMSALHISAEAGQNDVILMLIAKFPDISELLDNRGGTAVHVAAESGKSNAIKIFLSTPVLADLINHEDDDGNTPFHSAAIKGHYEVLQLLANDCRVDKGAINKGGFTVFDIIKSSTQLKQHKKAQILWKLKARGALRSLEQSEANRTRGEGQTEQTERKEPGRGVNKENEAKHVAILEKKDASHCIKKSGDVDLLVATIVAALTFAAALTMSAGYCTECKDQGMAVLNQKFGFRVYMVACSLAFGLSTASMFVHYGASRVEIEKDHIAGCSVQYALLFTEWSIYAMVLAFLSGISVVLTGLLGLATAIVTTFCFILGPLVYFLVTVSIRN